MSTIGLLSDSHGDANTTARAMQVLLDHQPDLIIHLGDICGDSVIQALIQNLDVNGQPSPPIHLVFGNCDWDNAGQTRLAMKLGIQVAHPIGRLNMDGRSIVFQHGHLHREMQDAIDSGVDFLFHGHTHQQRDEVAGRTHIINPGALHRAARYTVAIANLADSTARFFDV